MRAYVVPTSLALAGGLAAGLLVVARRVRRGARERLAALPNLTFGEVDLTSSLLHLPAGVR